MIKKLGKFMHGYWSYVVIGTIAMSIEAACELALPSIVAKIIDTAIPSGDTASIFKYGTIMILLALIGMAGGVTCCKYSAVAAQGFGSKVRASMFDKVSDFSFHNIDTFSTASLTTRLTNDVTNIQNTIMMSLRMLVRAPSMLVIACFFAFSINAKLSSVILVALPIILIAVGIIMKIGFPMFQKMQKRIDAVNSIVQENLIGIRVVKAFVREDHEKEKFKTVNDNLMKTGSKAAGMIVIAMPLMMLIFNVTAITIMWFGGNDVGKGTLEVGQLTALIGYVIQILFSVMMVAMILLQVARAKACGERIVEVLDTEIDIVSKEQTKDADIKGNIEFQNVSFKYKSDTHGDDILSDINFKANTGEFIGIMGGTGSGKTSLVSLIPRLYDVTSGKVLIDGVDVRDYDIEKLRHNIGVVLQKNVLFSGTIKENLLWGNENATDEEIVAACKSAQAHDFIMSQPDGYDTYLAQGGLNLSGGQKQRLCIARAMIKKPKILILDDSTSAVDTATEAGIRKSFKTDLQGTTVLVIAQRISSVEDADKIIILDDGKIDAIGTHSELIENNDIYQEIYATQQKGALA